MEHKGYQTRQKQLILDYIKSLDGDHATASDIIAYFKSKGITMGTATVYRRLEKLSKEGVISKCSIDTNMGACFSYICDGENDCCLAHCKCEKCGKLIHLECDELSRLEEHILKSHGFKLNSKRTVFYGLCDECRKKEEI